MKDGAVDERGHKSFEPPKAQIGKLLPCFGNYREILVLRHISERHRRNAQSVITSSKISKCRADE